MSPPSNSSPFSFLLAMPRNCHDLWDHISIGLSNWCFYTLNRWCVTFGDALPSFWFEELQIDDRSPQNLPEKLHSLVRWIVLCVVVCRRGLHLLFVIEDWHNIGFQDFCSFPWWCTRKRFRRFAPFWLLRRFSGLQPQYFLNIYRNFDIFSC